MTPPERLREIERLFHEARERMPAERDAFLARACADDPTLRRGVESLLAQPPAGVIDAPVGALAAELVTPPAPRLAPGSSVGPYHATSIAVLRAKALNALGWMAAFQGDFPTAFARADESLALGREAGDLFMVAECLFLPRIRGSSTARCQSGHRMRGRVSGRGECERGSVDPGSSF